MKCPKCGHEMAQKYYKGMFEVDSCPNCRGMWLDANELDKLEDIAFDDDAQKGSLIHSQQQAGHPCPVCETPMQEFQYRLYDLKLDYCAENNHGFWLDAGEDERVLEIMRQRAGNIQRKIDAEMEWKQTIRNMHSFLTKKSKK